MTLEHIAVLLAARDTVPGHKPWPRCEVDDATWTRIAEGLGAGQGELLTLFARRRHGAYGFAQRGSIRAMCRVLLRDEG